MNSCVYALVVEERGKEAQCENRELTSEDEDAEDVCTPIVVPDEDIEEEPVHAEENIPNTVDTVAKDETDNTCTVRDGNLGNVPLEVPVEQNCKQEET